METINTIELADANQYPDEQVLKPILGSSYHCYQKALDFYSEAGLTYEWRYYRDGKAWLCKVQFKKRTIVWMSAWKGYMQATVYIPEKHFEAFHKLDLTDTTREKIGSTKKVGKSLPCIFELREESILPDFEKVVDLKIHAR